jgi:hypothetical protein
MKDMPMDMPSYRCTQISVGQEWWHSCISDSLLQLGNVELVRPCVFLKDYFLKLKDYFIFIFGGQCIYFSF